MFARVNQCCDGHKFSGCLAVLVCYRFDQDNAIQTELFVIVFKHCDNLNLSQKHYVIYFEEVDDKLVVGSQQTVL